MLSYHNRKGVVNIECIRPMIRIEYNQQYLNKKGELSYKSKIWSPDLRTDMNWYDTDYTSSKIYKETNGEEIRRINIIPCNRCVGCRLSASADKAVQCMLEKQNPIYGKYETWFLTFTYDNKHIPGTMYVDANTGELHKGVTIDKSDLQKFWKKMRKGTEEHAPMPNLKYLCCNEYGSVTNRPHAHAIVFGMPIDPTKFIHRGNNEMGDALFESPEVNEWWGKGTVIIAEVSYRSIAYVARYTLKKTVHPIEDWWYESQGKDPENSSQSQKLGRWYYDLHKHDMYKTDTVPVKDTKGNLCKPPKAFDRLYKAEFPEEWEKIAKRRENAKIEALRSREEQTELKGREYLAVLEQLQEDFKDLRKGDYANVI